MAKHAQQSKYLSNKIGLAISIGVISNGKEINKPVNNHDR